jgi:hypothetical protein
LLSSWGVAFEAVDLVASPDRWEELRRLGVPAVPAVVLGERAVHGWNPTALAGLVGQVYVEPAVLPPEELTRRLDRVLAATARALAQVPPARLEDAPTSGRERSVRQLGYHVFRLSVAFVDAQRTRRLPQAWLQEGVPPEFDTPQRLVRYGERVRAVIGTWLTGPGSWSAPVETYYGLQTGHQLLERTTWHAAQHLRQLYAYLERIGVRP